MKLSSVIALLLASFLFGAGLAGSSDEPRQIMWKDLGPPADQSFSRLSKLQALQLTDIAGIRERKARGEKVATYDVENERTTSRKLEEAGFDVDAMLARRKEYMEGGRQQGRAVNAELDGQTVRMPGYILPLEFSGKDITEFLLVPYVGACIHTPPPPPNQIVHVKTDKPVSNVTVFSPVWVTGRLSAVSAKKSLSLVDGASEINVGYAIRASVVELYKQ
ncbi:MAG: DUF3299 domain-containing protein [Betaproteobacteria bacterium]